MFEQPLTFVEKSRPGKHIVLFHEEPEYARMISFQYIKNGLRKAENCSYITEEEEDIEFLKREMKDSGINIDKYIKQKNLLHIHQVPNLALSKRATEKIIEIVAEELPNRIVLKCIYKVNTPSNVVSNIKWENRYRYNDFKNLISSLVCTYPVDDINYTISNSKSIYGKWMKVLLENYDAVIFARKFWKGVAFNLS